MSIQHLILSTYDETLHGTPLGSAHITPTDILLLLIHRADRCFKLPEKNFPLELHDDYIKAWKSVYGEGHTAFESSIEGALNLAKKIGDEHGGMQTLITGSLYLIGGALRLLEPNRPRLA